jgi:hypothetical protein
VGERFAAHVGVRVDPSGDGSPCGCGATATLAAPPHWLGAHGDRSDGDSVGQGGHRAGEVNLDAGSRDAPLPTGAVLALVDAAARAAARAAVTAPGRQTTLVPMATGVQYGMTATGSVTARATVPCEGVLLDRADERGVLRFSVAVDVVDALGGRVASATVQWLATVDPGTGASH